MHPEIGATELLVIAAVALIVVGPKDLPILLRKLGQMMAKVRNMANDFRASFDEMARQSELDELRREVDAMRRGQFADMAGLNAGHAEVTDTFNEIDHSLSGVQFPPRPVEPAAEPAPAPVITAVDTPKPAPKPRAKPKPKVAKAEASAPAAAPKRKAAAKSAPASTAAKPRAAPRARKPKSEADA